jgi:autotransporter-associated beta strand protein
LSTGPSNPIIAAFFGDIDTRTPSSAGATSAPIYLDFDTVNGVFSATWAGVNYYQTKGDKQNFFQMQLYDRGAGDFDIVFRYQDIQWTTGDSSGGTGGLGGTVARAGLSAGNGVDFFELPASGNQANILDLENQSGNTGIVGLWVFEVRNGSANIGCNTTANADTCLITDMTSQSTAIDGLGGIDILQLGSATNFNFALGGLGTVFTNFEDLEKTGANTVTVTGVGSVPGEFRNTSGVVTLDAGAHLSAATITNSAGATINVGVGATLQGTGNTLNNAGVLNVAANGIVTDAGDVNNLATGVINFNGPGGTATLSSGGPNGIVNDGVINVVDGNVAVTGSIAQNNQLNVTGGNMTGIAGLTAGAASVTNIAATRSVSVATFTSTLGGALTGAGTLNASTGFTLDNLSTGVTLAGTGGLTKTGPGTVILSGQNTFTGDVMINGGTLAVSFGNAIANTVTVNVGSGATLRLDTFETIGALASVASDATVDLTNFDLTIAGGQNTIYAGSLIGAAPRSIVNTGTGRLELTGDSSGFTGGIFATGAGSEVAITGTGRVNSAAVGADTGALFSTDGGAILASNAILGVNGQATFTGSETVGTVAGDLGVIANAAGTITLTGAGTTLTVTGAANPFNPGNANGIDGTISGAGTLNITGGSFEVGATGNVQTATTIGAMGTVVNNGAMAAVTNAGVLTNSGSIAGIVTNNGGTVNLNVGGNLNGNAINNNGAPSILNVNGATSGIGAVVQTAGAVTNLFVNATFGSLAGTGPVNLSANTLTTGGDNSSTTFAGVIAGTGGLTKTGTGSFTLSGTNSYLGATQVNGGMLTLSGGSAISDAGSVGILGGATLALTSNETIGSVAGLAGSTISLGNNVLTTGGNGNTTTFAGSITGNGGLTKIGAGDFTLSGANSYLGATQVNGGTLTLAGGAAIADTGSVGILGGATLALTSNETIGSVAGLAGSSIALGANTLTTGGNNNTTSFAGTSSGTGGLTKVGAGTFSTGSLANTGTNTINAGGLNINGNVAGNIVVNAGGTLSGNVNIAGNLTLNPGGFLSPGNSPGTVNVAGNFAGGGTETVEVQFNNAGAPVNGTTHDFLNVTGNVSGVTTINIVPFAPSTAPAGTTGNGMELVRVGGSTAANAFTLSGPVIQGGFEYALVYLANYSGTTDGYFLQSGPRQELRAISGAAMASAALNASCSSVESRIDAAKNSRRHGWVTGEAGNLETGADSGMVSDGETACVNTGMTFASGLPGLNIGFSLGMGSYGGDLTLISGNATLDGSRFGAEAIVSYAQDMFFVTAAGGFVNQDFQFQGTVFTQTGSASGLTGNVAAGVQLPVAGVAELTLAGIFDYNDAVCRDGCFGFAAYAAGDAIMTGTVRASAKAQFGALAPYASVSYSTVLSDDPATVLGAAMTSFTGDGLVSAALGASVNITPATRLFVEGRYKDSQDSDASGQSVAAGLRAAW